jgi:hypothetical protein
VACLLGLLFDLGVLSALVVAENVSLGKLVPSFALSYVRSAIEGPHVGQMIRVPSIRQTE